MRNQDQSAIVARSGSSYKVERETFHYLWNKKHKPALHVKSGDRLKFEVNEVASWQITKEKDLARRQEVRDRVFLTSKVEIQKHPCDILPRAMCQ